MGFCFFVWFGLGLLIFFFLVIIKKSLVETRVACFIHAHYFLTDHHFITVIVTRTVVLKNKKQTKKMECLMHAHIY